MHPAQVGCGLHISTKIFEEEEYDSNNDRRGILFLDTIEESNKDELEEQDEKAQEEGVEGIVDLEVELSIALEEIDNLRKENKKLSKKIIFIKTEKRGGKNNGRSVENITKR